MSNEKPIDSAETKRALPHISASVTIGDEAPSSPKKSGGFWMVLAVAIKELFHRASKKALSWICAAIATGVIIVSMGLAVALIKYGLWNSPAPAKQAMTWELVEVSHRPVIEFYEFDKSGKAIVVDRKDIPADVKDPQKWATQQYGKQTRLPKLPEEIKDNK